MVPRCLSFLSFSRMKDEPEKEKTQSEEQAQGLIDPSSFILHPFFQVVATDQTRAVG